MRPITESLGRPFARATEPARYKVWYGGRGSGKSTGVAKLLIAVAATKRVRILCAREFQNSIADSVHKLLQDQISEMGIQEYFHITSKSITASNGSEFIFKGLHYNIPEVKSLEGIDICWVEEAQRVSEESWKILIPTIRKERSEIWVTFNPDQKSDPTYQRFVVNPPPQSIVVRVNYDANPWLPNTLRAEMEYMRQVDYPAYENVWLGNPKHMNTALVYAGKYEISAFEPPSDVHFYFGADWGFAQDPTALIRCWIKGRRLYIDYEAWGIGIEIDETPALFDMIPGSRKWPIKADSARPETISAIRRAGFHISATEKWPGSVADGIATLRSFERIIVHERCRHVIDELGKYQYKTDQLTGEILPVPIDRDNHCMDAIRYALGRQAGPMYRTIRARGL